MKSLSLNCMHIMCDKHDQIIAHHPPVCELIVFGLLVSFENNYVIIFFFLITIIILF